MAIRRLMEFSALFWETQLISNDEINSWIGIFISLLMLTGVIFIRQIFNLQDRIDELRKESESRLLNAVIQTEEKARQSFARELHDGLGPVLSSIKMILTAIDQEKLDAENQKIIEHTCKTTDEAIVTLKEISNHLSPHLLKNYGLVNALEKAVGQILNNTKIHFDLIDNINSKRFPNDLEINVFRIITELINNSLKHGAPNKIVLSIQETGPSLNIKYVDDGRGFDFSNYPNNARVKGMGLENIQSRVKSLNGYFHMNSAIGNGVRVIIQIPLK